MNQKFIRPPSLSLPPGLAEIVSGYAWQQNHTGMTSARVFRLAAEDKKSLYLKIGSRASIYSLWQEKLRLDWLKKRLPVPEALLYAANETREYLLLSEIHGQAAVGDSLKGDIPNIIEQLAKGLKMIHLKVPVKNCPFDRRIKFRIETARKAMLEGLVAEEDFDDERQGRTAEDLFRELLANLPAVEERAEDLVFTHGDYCAANVILENGKLRGFVDWGEAGVADRHQDLALLSRDVSCNFGPQWQEYVFKIYGIEPDWKKIHFYRLLDEFF